MASFGAAAALDGGISLTDAVVVLPGAASIARARGFSSGRRPQRRCSAPPLARHEQALLAQAQQSAACNASHSVEARLSRWLLRARDLCDSETLPLTQEFLAQMIGVQRNAISIVAHALQQAGIIRYSRGHIDIKDVARFEADGLRVLRRRQGASSAAAERVASDVLRRPRASRAAVVFAHVAARYIETGAGECGLFANFSCQRCVSGSCSTSDSVHRRCRF